MKKTKTQNIIIKKFKNEFKILLKTLIVYYNITVPMSCTACSLQYYILNTANETIQVKKDV